MGTEGRCGKCGSLKIVPRAPLVDIHLRYNVERATILVGVSRKPDAVIFKHPQTAGVYARVCGDCGFAELFVDDAQSLYDAYLESL